MNTRVRDRLIEVARLERLITYSELVSECGLDLDLSLQRDRTEIGRVLGDISKYEVENGRPRLSAIVVNQSSSMPSEGFYNYAKELNIHTGEADEIFFAREVRKIYDHWEN